MTVARTREQKVGDHLLWFEEPDTLVLEVHGAVNAKEAEVIMTEQITLAERRRYLFLLVDLTAFTSISAEARRTFGKDTARMPPLASAYFGGSFRARVMAEMVFTIFNLFGKKRHQYRVCESGEAARAYFAEVRPSYVGAIQDGR